eukprot:86127-Amphidinium_carterae.1
MDCQTSAYLPRRVALRRISLALQAGRFVRTEHAAPDVGREPSALQFFRTHICWLPRRALPAAAVASAPR